MIKTIRNKVVKGLHDFTGCMVVDTDNNHKKPEYPYISFKFITTRRNSGEAGVRKQEFKESLDPNFDVDYVTGIEFQPYAIISMQCYSDDVLDSQELAMKCWEWFKLNGRFDFEDINAVVVDITDIQDRTVLRDISYEYRNGFDVRVRYLHEFEHRHETIEEYTVHGKVGRKEFTVKGEVK
jgi:hypothetical protein